MDAASGKVLDLANTAGPILGLGILDPVQAQRKKRGNQGLEAASRTQHLLHLLDNGALP